MNPCIVYLAQNSKRDPQYGRDSRTLMEKSLDLLYKNYNDQFKHPIIIFHEGDFEKKDQVEVVSGRSEITFHEIHFSIPKFLSKAEIPEIWNGQFGMGHRHMIRFYGLQIFDLLEGLGYDWFFRMDDDSFFHSKINYNLFEYMQGNGFEYGYRVDIKEPLSSSYGFSDSISAYLKAEKITPYTFYDNFENAEETQKADLSVYGSVKKTLIKTINWVADKLNYEVYQWPATSEWNRWGYYNNFFITNIKFWKQPEVQSLLNYFDRVGGAYKYRWNDLILQTVVVQIFLSPKKVHKFTDWTYEHATIKENKLIWGGIYEGTDDSNSKAVTEFKSQYGKIKIDQSY